MHDRWHICLTYRNLIEVLCSCVCCIADEMRNWRHVETRKIRILSVLISPSVSPLASKVNSITNSLLPKWVVVIAGSMFSELGAQNQTWTSNVNQLTSAEKYCKHSLQFKPNGLFHPELPYYLRMTTHWTWNNQPWRKFEYGAKNTWYTKIEWIHVSSMSIIACR